MITVGFSTYNRSIMSRLIRWFSGSKHYSHSWIAYDDLILGQPMIIEAEAWGIVQVPYGPYAAGMDNLTELVPPEGVVLGRGLPVIGATLGSSYDYASVVGRLWVYFWSWLGKKVKNPLGNVKRDSCIENVLRYLDAEGLMPNGIDPESTSPEEVYGILLQSGWHQVKRLP